MAKKFSVNVVFKAVDRMVAPVTRMQNQVGMFSRSIDRNFRTVSRSVDRFSTGLKKSLFVGAAALAGFSGAMSKVVKTGASFEQELVSASAKFTGEISRGTKAFEELQNAARETGRTTEFTATQTAQALNFLAKAGFNAQSAISALPGIVDLATAAELDLGRASDIATDSLGAFNLMTADTGQLSQNLGRINDVFAKTASSVNTDVSGLFETVKLAGPIIAAAGASVETFAALSGVLAEAGIKDTVGGTTLRNLFTATAALDGKVPKIFRALKVNIEDLNGDFRDTFDILEDLAIALEPMGAVQRLGTLKELFGVRALPGINVLLAKGADGLRAFRNELDDVDLFSNKMANTMRDTLQGRLNSLKSAIEGVSISIFNLNNTALSEAIEKTTEWVRANESLIASNIGNFLAKIINNFENIVTWTKRIGIGLAVFFTLNTVLKAFVGIMTAVNIVMAANPIGLVIIGVSALIVALTAAFIWIDKIRDGFLALSIPMKVITAILVAMTGPIGALIAAASLVMIAWEPIKNLFIDIWDIITKVARALGFNIGKSDELTVSKQTAPKGLGLDNRFDPVELASPQERMVSLLREERLTQIAEVLIKDESGRAEITKSTLGQRLKLQPSGAF